MQGDEKKIKCFVLLLFPVIKKNDFRMINGPNDEFLNEKIVYEVIEREQNAALESLNLYKSSIKRKHTSKNKSSKYRYKPSKYRSPLQI